MGEFGWAYVKGTQTGGPQDAVQFAKEDKTLDGNAALTFNPSSGILNLTGTLNVSGGINANFMNIDVTNKVVHNVEQYGSTKFGNTSDDLHQITGSFEICSGSIKIHASDSASGSISMNSAGYMYLDPGGGSDQNKVIIIGDLQVKDDQEPNSKKLMHLYDAGGDDAMFLLYSNNTEKIRLNTAGKSFLNTGSPLIIGNTYSQATDVALFVTASSARTVEIQGPVTGAVLISGSTIVSGAADSNIVFSGGSISETNSAFVVTGAAVISKSMRVGDQIFSTALSASSYVSSSQFYGTSGSFDGINIGNSNQTTIIFNQSTDDLEVSGKYLSAKNNLRVQSSGYISFGGTDTDSGYGLKDNSGVLQYKNNSGAWRNLLPGAGNTSTIQINTDDDVLAGSANLTYLTSSNTLNLTGTLNVSGAINANELNVNVLNKTVTNIDQYGSTKFGDSTDDNHFFTGSLVITGASNSQVTSSGGNVISTNPALIVSGAAVFTDNIQVKGTFYGASPIKFASPLAITGSDGEVVQLDGKDHIGNKNIVGNFNVTGAINITGSEVSDGMNIKMGNLTLENDVAGRVVSNVGPNLVLKSSTDNALHRPSINMSNNVTDHTSNAYCGQLNWKATSRAGAADTIYAQMDTYAKTDGDANNDYGIFSIRYRNSGMSGGFPLGLAIQKDGAYSRTAIHLYGSLHPYEGYGKQSYDHTVGTSTRPWGDFYVADNKEINFGTSSVTLGYNTTSEDLEVVGKYLSAKGHLRLPSSGYLIYGNTDGASGYGFRDNSGELQFKNNGTNWMNMQAVHTGSGEDHSLQFKRPDNSLTGSAELTYHTGSNVLTLSGTLNVSGTINANAINVAVVNKTVTNVEQYGSTKFGDSTDDLHQFTGSMQVGTSVSSSVFYATHLSASNYVSASNAYIVSLSASNYVSASSVYATDVSASNYVSASNFYGDGSDLTGIAVKTYSNGSNNRVLTSVDASTINGESNLTFDGSILNVVGSLTSSLNVSSSAFYGVSGRLDEINIGNNSETKLKYNSSSEALEVTGKVLYATANIRSSEYLNFSAVNGAGGIGIRSNSGVIEFKNNGGNWLNVSSKRVSVTSTHTASISDHIIGISASATMDVRLPNASDLEAGQIYIFKDEAGNAGSYSIQIKASGSQTIDGHAEIILESPYAAVNLYTDGASKYFVF